MKTKFWMFLVLTLLIYIAPVLLIMMMLVLTPIPLHNAFIYWLPIAIVVSIVLTWWYQRQSKKQLR